MRAKKATKKNVIIIGSAYPLRGGGIATYNERLAKAFADNGDKVIIHTFSLQYPSIFFPGKTQYSDEAPPKDLNIEVSVNSINPFNWIRVGRRLKRLKPDLVIVRYWIPFISPCLGTISRIVRKNKHTKIIAIADNIIPHEKKPGDKILTRYFVKSVDGFITMSQSVLQDLEYFEKNKPKRYCPHPLYDNFGTIATKEEARKKLQLDLNQKYVLFFGFIREYKGLDILLKAFSHPKIREIGVKLLVVGEFYANPDQYYALIEENRIEDLVILRTNFIPNTEVRLYFSAVDLVAQPYKEATQSGVTQVAYHFNKPMITTNVGGLSEIVPDGKVGYVTKPDHKEVAEAIVNFFSLGKEDEFVTNIIEEKKKYSWEMMLQEIDQLYQEIV